MTYLTYIYRCIFHCKHIYVIDEILTISVTQIAKAISKGVLAATVKHQVYNQLPVKVTLLCTSVLRHVLRQEKQVPSCLWPGVEAGALHR